jgi:hypothetical protein
VPAVTVAPESHPEGVVPSAARLSQEHGEACGWRLVLTGLRLCREGSSRACYHRTLPQLFLQVSPWGCVAPTHPCGAGCASAWLPWAWPPVPVSRGDVRAVIASRHVWLPAASPSLKDSLQSWCSQVAHLAQQLDNTPAYLRETGVRTYGRPGCVPTGDAPRTYGRRISTEVFPPQTLLHSRL